MQEDNTEHQKSVPPCCGAMEETFELRLLGGELKCLWLSRSGVFSGGSVLPATTGISFAAIHGGSYRDVAYLGLSQEWVLDTLRSTDVIRVECKGRHAVVTFQSHSGMQQVQCQVGMLSLSEHLKREQMSKQHAAPIPANCLPLHAQFSLSQTAHGYVCRQHGHELTSTEMLWMAVDGHLRLSSGKHIAHIGVSHAWVLELLAADRDVVITSIGTTAVIEYVNPMDSTPTINYMYCVAGELPPTMRYPEYEEDEYD